MRNPNNSRPLTVGEIAANWEDLKDTLRIKYNVDKKDPFPIIRQKIMILLEDDDNEALALKATEINVNENILACLGECAGDIYVLLSNSLQKDMAVKSFSKSSLRANIRVGATFDRSNNILSSLTDAYPEGKIDVSLPTIKLVDPIVDEKNDLTKTIEAYIKNVDNESDVFVMCDYNTLLSTKQALIGPDR